MSEKRYSDDEISDTSKKIRSEETSAQPKSNVGIDALGAGAGAEVSRITFTKPSLVDKFVSKEKGITPDFIISAHGKVKPKDTMYVPNEFIIYSLTNLRSSSQTLCCPNDYEMTACGVKLNEHAEINEYDGGKTIFNIYYGEDEEGTFKSGVYDCEAQDFIEEIEVEDNNLASILEELKNYTTNRPIRVYNLSCNVSEKCNTLKEKIVKIDETESAIQKNERTAYEYYRTHLSAGKYKDDLITFNTIILFFIDYYGKVIKNPQVFNLNYKEALTICNSINKFVRFKIATVKPEEETKIVTIEYDTKLARLECMRTAGILLNAIIGIERWSFTTNPEIGKLKRIAETLVQQTEQTTSQLAQSKDTLPDDKKLVVMNILYYRSLIINLLTYIDVRVLLASIEKQITRFPDDIFEKHKSELQLLARKQNQIDIWYDKLVNTSEIGNISQLSAKVTELRKIKEEINNFLPKRSTVGARRTYRNPRKNREKTIRK